MNKPSGRDVTSETATNRDTTSETVSKPSGRDMTSIACGVASCILYRGMSLMLHAVLFISLLYWLINIHF